MPWINRLCLDCNSCHWSCRRCTHRTLDKHACTRQHNVLGMCLLLFLLPCGSHWLRATFLYKHVQQILCSSIFTPSDTRTNFYHVSSHLPVFTAHDGLNFFEMLLIYCCLPCIGLLRNHVPVIFIPRHPCAVQLRVMIDEIIVDVPLALNLLWN